MVPVYTMTERTHGKQGEVLHTYVIGVSLSRDGSMHELRKARDKRFKEQPNLFFTEGNPYELILETTDKKRVFSYVSEKTQLFA